MQSLRAITMLLLLWTPVLCADTIRVAVAANFKPTLAQINQVFEANTGHRVKLTSASSGALASQLLNGAPFDIFFSADEKAPAMVAGKIGATSGGPFCYAQGRLALVGGDGQLHDLRNPNLSVAIANPATAPYGRAAMDVLTRAEFNAGTKRKLVRGNNAIQAYQFWYTGATDLALVPLPLAVKESALPVPVHWHQPIRQSVLIVRPNAVVDAYMKWFRSDTVRSMIQQAGYLPCH